MGSAEAKADPLGPAVESTGAESEGDPLGPAAEVAGAEAEVGTDPEEDAVGVERPGDSESAGLVGVAATAADPTAEVEGSGGESGGFGGARGSRRVDWGVGRGDGGRAGGSDAICGAPDPRWIGA